MTSRHIYIVDDDASVRESLLHLLSTAPDTDVTGFASGEAFLRAAPGLSPGSVLLDLNMPGTSGIDVLEALTPLRGKFGVIVLTGEGQVGTAVQAMKLGALDFLQKPCNYAQIFAAIEQAFSKQSHSQHVRTRREEAQAKIALLSARELEVLHGLIAGRSNKMIAHDHGISPRTVEIHRGKLMEKLSVRSLPEALGIAFAAGLYPGS